MPTSETNSTLPILDQLVLTAQQAVSQSIGSAKQKQANAAKGEAIATEQSNTLNVIAGDVAVVAATKNAADLKVQAENARIARAAGIDPETGANILVDTVTKLRQSNAETEAALKEYRKKNESSFLDNPLSWVADQITLPIAEAKLKGSAAQSALYADQLTKVNATLQNSFQTTEKLKESMTTASADAATRVATAQSLIESKKFALEALKYNTQGIQEAQNATREQLSYLYNAFNAQKAEQQLILAQESGALSRERFNVESAARREMADARGNDKVMDDAVLAKINVGRASMGMKPLEGPEAQFALAKMKSGAGGDVQTYYELGDRAASLGHVSYGGTPAESMKTLLQLQPELPDIKKETAALLDAAMKAVPPATPKAAVDGFINKFVKDQLAEQFRTIIPNSQNLFDVGDLSSYLTLSEIKDLPVTQKVLAPLAAAGVKLDDPRMVLGFMKKAVRDGSPTLSQIGDLSIVYRKANQVNQAARDFRAFNMILPNNGKNYFAKVSTFGNPVDMTDPTAIQNYLSKELAREMSSKVFYEHGMPTGSGVIK